MNPAPNWPGIAGEYFVAAELSRRGFIASISMRNTRGIKIPDIHEEGNMTTHGPDSHCWYVNNDIVKLPCQAATAYLLWRRREGVLNDFGGDHEAIGAMFKGFHRHLHVQTT